MPLFVDKMVERLSARLHARSAVVLSTLEQRLPVVVLAWGLLVTLASLVRIALSPSHLGQEPGLAPYMLLTLAPLASFGLAMRWFAGGATMPQPSFRLARIGRWRNLSPAEAAAQPLYGTSGIMVSLLIGMLLNVPVRTAEYLVTMPAITAGAPAWLATLHLAMTVDVVVMNCLYVVAFVMALCRVPSFPRFLLLVWMVDILSQTLIAQTSMVVGLPSAVAGSLHGLLDGNVKKVLISMSIWLPYLILSTRVNLTYRNRLPA